MTLNAFQPRRADGKFTSRHPLTPARVQELYATYLAVVAHFTGQTVDGITEALANNRGFSKEFRAAAYARQLALYLTATEHNAPHVLLASAANVDNSTVGKALGAIEDLRDDREFEQLIEAVLVQAAMMEGVLHGVSLAAAQRMGARPAGL